MANKHLYLKNSKNQNTGFNRKRGFKPVETNEQEEDKPKTIKLFQIHNLRSNYTTFIEARETRYAHRTIEFPAYIDLIQIHFFSIFNTDLRNKFFIKYGLTPVSYSDFNRTVLFEVSNENSFEQFKSDIEHVISHEEDVEYSGEDHNLIALVWKFRFINKRSYTNQEKGIIITTIHSANQAAESQRNSLKDYLIENEIEYNLNDSQDIFYLKQVSAETLKNIELNFDIVQSITSSRTLTIRPGMFGNLRMEYGFQVEIPDDLITIGIIDTGVNQIQPFQGLIINDSINITNETDADQTGHGTLVAGLSIFGEDLPANVQESYKANCKVLPIKALHDQNDSINFPLLLEAIKTAKKEHGVRIFNMSLVFDFPKRYNDTFSDFAFELDKLAYELDILIFISVGNFNDRSLRELLTTDYHDDHAYPTFFYSLDSDSPVHDCANTNICTPSESLNNISIGSLARNIEEGDNSDITPLNIYPAYYSRKFHFDYEQKVNNTAFKKKQKNKHLNKPDFVYDGGDLFKEDSGIEVLANEGDFYGRTSGTSLSAPILASMAAEIQNTYPNLHVQSIKALLINSASYYKPSQLPLFKDKNNKRLLRKLIGFGVPKREHLIESDNNSVMLVVEDQIKLNEIISIPIYIPEYLKKSGNKLIFNISLAYKFFPDKGNHLGYLPLHMSFNLVKNISINDIATKKSIDTVAKKGFSWSEDHFGIDNIIFSNAQKQEYRLQPNDIKKLNGEIAIAVRCLSKKNIDDNLKTFLEQREHPFSLVIRITEELKNNTSHNLYSEMLAINNLTAISSLSAEGDLELEA